jgi:hypothetical protein
MSLVSSAYYGIAAEPVQPTGGAGPQPMPEATTPIATTPAPGRLGVFHQAGFWIVALVAIAIGLVHLSIRFS